MSLKTRAGWSPEKHHWVKTPPGPPSGPPLSVQVSPKSSTEMEVKWSEPQKWKRNGVIVGYSVVYTEMNDQSNVKVKNVTDTSKLEVVLQSLKMFTYYEIRVRAIGEAGVGPLSNPVVERTDQDGK